MKENSVVHSFLGEIIERDLVGAPIAVIVMVFQEAKLTTSLAHGLSGPAGRVIAAAIIDHHNLVDRIDDIFRELGNDVENPMAHPITKNKYSDHAGLLAWLVCSSA